MVSSTSIRVRGMLRLPFDASSVPLARSRVREFLTEAGRSQDCVDDARMVVSELVANAVRHARPLPDGRLLVSWALEGGGLQVSVSDGGSPTRPRALETATSSLSGRGMTIVEALSDTWWSEQADGRSTGHALLPV